MYIKRDRDVLSTVEYDIPITKNIHTYIYIYIYIYTHTHPPTYYYILIIL